MIIYHCSPLAFRDHLSKLIPPKSRVVEVGTHQGEYARGFLANWAEPGEFHCVDPWSVPQGYEEQAKGLPSATGDRAKDLEMARNALAPFAPHVHWHIALSEDAAKEIEDGSVDLVYVDANHEPEAVLADLRTWWPKLRVGGIMAGHDVMATAGHDGWGPGIQWALNTFMDGLGCPPPPVFLLVEAGGMPWSFHFTKES